LQKAPPFLLEFERLREFRRPTNNPDMKSFFPILLRVVGVFAVACAVQYIIPWYLLAAFGVAAGFFMLKTSDDRATALGVLIGSIVFGIFAYAMGQIYPVGG
jgi:hypothetical protein